MNSVVIVAGGSSSRLQSEVPKQFLKIDNKEILSFSVNTFLNHPKIDEVIIVCHIDWLAHVNKNYSNCIVVKGGKTRQISSNNGIYACDEYTENILIHDAARPFISSKLISQCILQLQTYKACAPVLDSNNSLISIQQQKASYVNRNTIKIVQTPQCFNASIIKDVHNSGISGTDEIGMLLQSYPYIDVNFIDGEINNFKITTDYDLKKAELLLNINN